MPRIHHQDQPPQRPPLAQIGSEQRFPARLHVGRHLCVAVAGQIDEMIPIAQLEEVDQLRASRCAADKGELAAAAKGIDRARLASVGAARYSYLCTTVGRKLVQVADAEQEYKQVLALDPSSADELAGLANIYMRGQRYSEAGDVLRKLLAVRPNDAGAHMQLGRILAIAGHNEDAIVELQTALKLAPDDVNVRRDLAEVYVSADKFDEAGKQYRALLAVKPKDAELHARLGKALMKQRQFPEAQQELLAAVQLNPEFGDAYDNLAISANENKNYELAIKALEARAKFVPDNPGSYFLRATTYDHLRDYKRAAENYRKFLEVAEGKFPDQEWQARHRLIAIDPKK
jgi:tetratricopeptide (TPR) repeat protein